MYHYSEKIAVKKQLNFMELKKNIILLDDHVIIRNGLKELIEKLGPFIISQQFDKGWEMMEYVAQYPEPDLFIMDLNMPGMNGDEVVEKLNKMGVRTPILVLTVNVEEEMIIKLFRLGVRGYLMKNCESGELKNALNAIFSMGYYHNEFLNQSLKAHLFENLKSEQEIILEQLSVREREFLRLVCHENEYTYEMIGDLMNVQHRTVDGYRESLFEKFKIKSKTGLVLFVLKHKLLDYL
jgi:two-component system, NarL family, invasion response regulator UvrY